MKVVVVIERRQAMLVDQDTGKTIATGVLRPSVGVPSDPGTDFVTPLVFEGRKA